MIATLPDYPCRPGGVLLVGINPAPVSVAAGHYYQGALGRRLWARLARVGLLEDAQRGREDEAFVAAGNGLTDLVKRPTTTATEVASEELHEGGEALRKKVREWRPRLILFAFRPPAEALLGPSVRPGVGPLFAGAATFLLSAPYTRRAEAEANEAELRAFLATRVNESGPRVDAGTALHRASAAGGPGQGGRTQRVTRHDLARGQIRLPVESVSGAKASFPRAPSEVTVLLRGERLDVSYDPRFGPDRERSGVLRIGRRLRELVDEGEVLTVLRDADRVPRLD